MNKSLNPVIILFTTGLICRLFGPVSFDLTNLAVIISWSIYLFTSIPLSKKNIIPVFILFTLLLTFSYINDSFFKLSLLCVFLFLLSVYSCKQELPKESHVLSLVTTVIFTISLFIYLYFPEGWYSKRTGQTIFNPLLKDLFKNI